MEEISNHHPKIRAVERLSSFTGSNCVVTSLQLHYFGILEEWSLRKVRL